MTISLNDKDLATIDALIKKTPFEYAYPLWKLLTDKISEQSSAKVTSYPSKGSVDKLVEDGKI